MDRPEAPAEPAARLRGRRDRDPLLAFAVVVSVFKIAAGLALVAAYRSVLQPGEFSPIVSLAHVAVFAGAALFLAAAGARDRRALDLGAFFLLVAVSFANGLLFRLAGLEGLPREIQEGLLAVHPGAFLPLFLWRFVARFPRLYRFDRGQAVERGFVAAATVLGVLCFLASVLGDAVRDSPLSPLSALGWGRPGRWFDAIQFGLAIPALPFGLWKARRADVGERRRYSIFMAGLLVGFFPIAAQVLAEAIFPSYYEFMNPPGRRLVVGLFLFPLLLSIPVTTTYSVLVHRVLDVKLIIRKAVRYAFARYTIVALAALLAAALGAAVVRHRDESLGALLTSASGLSIVAPLAVLLGLLGARRALLDAIDRRFFREALDTRALLSELSAGTAAGGETVAAVGRAVSQALQSSLHVAQADILVADWEAGTLRSAAGRLRNLSLHGSLAASLGRRPEGIVVELDHEDPLVGELPEDEQQWLADGGVHLMMPLTSSREFVGAMVLGEKLSELPFSSEDHRLLAPVAAAVALRIENLRLRDARNATTPTDSGAPGGRTAEEPAQVCVACSFVASATSPACPRCPGSLTPIQLPLVLAGKFRLERELGRGGMGVVYLAIDTALERRVAIKTLPRVSVAESVRLRREARAMAAFTHPHLALIFGVESWRGSPALVMEYLEGGTLADRLRRGVLTSAETEELARDLTGALALIHDEGLLHRDIKPSNIAFTRAGRPKLLDFGLAQMFVDRTPVLSAPRPTAGAATAASVSDLTTVDRLGVAGTPGYMAPEARAGLSLDGSADLWSLGVVLFECLTGERPFKGQPGEADLDLRIEERAPGCPRGLRELVADLLALDKRKRPRSARAVLSRLGGDGAVRAA